MFKYRLHSPDGDDLGEAAYAMQIHAGEEIIAGNAKHVRVLDVVEFEFVGAASGGDGVVVARDLSPFLISARRSWVGACGLGCPRNDPRTARAMFGVKARR
jgi:hypothetical protein